MYATVWDITAFPYTKKNLHPALKTCVGTSHKAVSELAWQYNPKSQF
jgi:hypothetical protein